MKSDYQINMEDSLGIVRPGQKVIIMKNVSSMIADCRNTT